MDNAARLDIRPPATVHRCTVCRRRLKRPSPDTLGPRCRRRLHPPAPRVRTPRLPTARQGWLPAVPEPVVVACDGSAACACAACVGERTRWLRAWRERECERMVDGEVGA